MSTSRSIASGGCGDGGRLGEDASKDLAELLERRLQRSRVAPGDESVGADEDRALGADPAAPCPHAARVVQVAVDVADSNGVQGDAGRGELLGGFAPGRAFLARDQQEATRLDQVLDR